VSSLAPGEHVVQLRRAAGTTVSLPFDVQVYEGTAFVGSNRGDRILVGAGRHTFDLVNESLRFRSQHTVVVGPGRTAALAVEVPRGALSVNAPPWAEVVIGGRSYGERHDVATIRLGAPNRVSVDLRK